MGVAIERNGVFHQRHGRKEGNGTKTSLLTQHWSEGARMRAGAKGISHGGGEGGQRGNDLARTAIKTAKDRHTYQGKEPESSTPQNISRGEQPTNLGGDYFGATKGR